MKIFNLKSTIILYTIITIIYATLEIRGSAIMPVLNHDAIEKLKITALRRCHERIIEASERTVGSAKENQVTPSCGITSHLKHRYGLL